MNNFIYSLNATLPIFLVMILGKVLFRIGIIDEHFVKVANRYVFYVALPALVFDDLGLSDLTTNWDTTFILYCSLITLLTILVIWVLTNVFMKDRTQQGAFIQASYRSSAAILGLAFIDNMYSDVGMAPLMILGAVPLYNIFAVIILTIKDPHNNGNPNLKHTFLEVIKNPILIGIFVALPFAFLHIPIPHIAEKTLSMVASTATPLALIVIGATFEGRKAIQKIKPTMLASFIKLIVLAALFLPLAISLGFRNQELMAALIMLASPTTATCYVMAKNTNNDELLSSSIIVSTTLFSSFTLTFWIFLLHSMGYL